MPEPVRILMDILERDRLGADVPAAEWILLVPADREDLVAPDANLDTAHGLAEVAGPVVGPFILGHRVILRGRRPQFTSITAEERLRDPVA